MKKENKAFKQFNFTLKKADDNNGEEGIIEAVASSNALDRTDDIIPEATLIKALQNARDEGQTKITMKFMHMGNVIIGRFPLDDMEIKDGKLHVKGFINIKTTQGKDAFELVKSGDLDSLSVGIWILDAEWKDGVRVITDMFIFEISIVDIPANQEAMISSVKAVTKDDVLEIKSIRDVETMLKSLGCSNEASKHIISVIKQDKHEEKMKSFLDDLKEFASEIK